MSLLMVVFLLSTNVLIIAQSGTGLPIWPVAVGGGGYAQSIDWRHPSPIVNAIPNTAPSDHAGAGAAFDGCGNLIFYVLHSGIANIPFNLFIYDRDGIPLLNASTPNGPGLNGLKNDSEISVVKVPGIHNQWYIIYSKWQPNAGAPNNNGGYAPTQVLYSRVAYTSQGLVVLFRDSTLLANGIAYTYTHGKSVSRTGANPNEHYLYVCRRSANQGYLSLDRFVISSSGIAFSANTGNVPADWWYLTIAGSPIELSPTEDRIAVINRNEAINYSDIFLFNSQLFSNAPGAYQIISLGQLILQPDSIVAFTAQSVTQTAASNPNLAFLSNMEKKVGSLEFSPNGRFLYFCTGGWVASGLTHTTYLGQIDLGPISSPAVYPYNLRLQIQVPVGAMNMTTGSGSSSSTSGTLWKSIREVQSSFDGRLYFSKQNSNALFVIPFPDQFLPQSLIPGTVDLSDSVNQNIAVPGFIQLLPDQIDGWDYIASNPSLLDIGPDTSICTGDTIILDAFVPGGNYLWQDGSTNASLKVYQSGTYWVQVEVDSCFDQDTIIISVFAHPNVILGNDTFLCQGDQLLLNVGQPGLSYLWQNGSTDSVLIVTQPGTYWVEVSQGNCSSSDTITVDFFLLPQLNFGPDTAICSGDCIIFDVSYPGASYVWQDGSMGSSFTACLPGLYWVSLTLGSCSVSDSIKLDIIPLPNVDLGQLLLLCPGDTLALLSPTLADAYLWSDGTTTPFIEITQNGAYWLKVWIDGCSASDTIVVQSYPKPSLDIGSDTTICVGDMLILSSDTVYVNYKWSTGESSRQIHVSLAGLYWLDVFDGCYMVRDSIELLMEYCDCNLFIPNAFTPNADGLNEYFEVKGECVTSYRILIFNRWGQMIFESHSMELPWDGTFSGALCPDASYVYRIEYTLGAQLYKQVKTGKVILLR